MINRETSVACLPLQHQPEVGVGLDAHLKVRMKGLWSIKSSGFDPIKVFSASIETTLKFQQIREVKMVM